MGALAISLVVAVGLISSGGLYVLRSLLEQKNVATSQVEQPETPQIDRDQSGAPRPATESVASASEPGPPLEPEVVHTAALPAPAMAEERIAAAEPPALQQPEQSQLVVAAIPPAVSDAAQPGALRLAPPANITLGKPVGNEQETGVMFCEALARSLATETHVFFPLASVDVDAQYNAALKRFAAMLGQCPKLRIDVAGHTDTTGDETSNFQLSWQRAMSVIKRLRSLGANTDQYAPVGYSSMRPFASGVALGDQSRNRRVEFLVR